MSEIGYIRVSTVGQNHDRQLSGLALDKVFSDQISGKAINRPGLKRCFEYLREGDTLHVHSMDRLARNLKDLQFIVDDLTGKGIAIQFHKENLTFTSDANAMSKLLLQVMGAVAEFERSLINERRLEGMAAAKKKGKRFGRPSALTEEQKQQIQNMRDRRVPVTEIAKTLSVSRQTVYTALKTTRTGREE